MDDGHNYIKPLGEFGEPVSLQRNDVVELGYQPDPDSYDPIAEGAIEHVRRNPSNMTLGNIPTLSENIVRPKFNSGKHRASQYI